MLNFNTNVAKLRPYGNNSKNREKQLRNNDFAEKMQKANSSKTATI